MAGSHRASGHHRGLATTVVTGVLAVSGVVCISVAVAADQQQPTQPPLSVADPRTPGPAPASSRSSPATATPTVVGIVLPASAPVTLTVPAIGVKSRLLHLGQAADGSLEVPGPGPQYNRAAWYRYSPTPGSLGPAVIAGHVDSAADGPSVFFRLGSLHRGDTILVTRSDGSEAVFAVDEVRRFHKKAFPSQLVYGNTDHAALRLITCGGTFDRASGNYLDNIVVLASLFRASGRPGPTTGPQAG